MQDKDHAKSSFGGKPTNKGENIELMGRTMPAALAEAGQEIKALLSSQVRVEHPEIPELNEIAYSAITSQMVR